MSAYLARFAPYRARLVVLVAAGVLQSFAYAPMAALLRRIFDDILPRQQSHELWVAAALLFALQAAGLLLVFFIRSSALRVSEEVLARVRRDGLSRLYDLPREFHVAADLERLHVTLAYETQWIERMNQAAIATVMPGVISAVALLAILFWLEPRLASILGVAAPALFVANRLVERDLWFRQNSLRLAFEEFSRGVRFVLRAMELTRAHAAEAAELDRQRAKIERLRDLTMSLARHDAAHQMLQGALVLACTLATLIAGGQAVADGSLTRGEVMAFYVMAALFATQARGVVAAIPEIRMGWRGWRQVEELLDHPLREPYQGTEPLDALGAVRLEGVYFRYGAEGPVLLEGVNLEIAPGARVALLGANGSGKSSLAALIGAFYRPQRGRLMAGGVEYDRLDPRALRRRMAFVPQQPFLFAGTVRENVTYGTDDTSGFEEALRHAGALDFVRALPHGADTAIGEDGGRLSGGQRQKLAIARALLRRPELLVLDEPTNHFDEAAIEELTRSLRELPQRPAVLIISHETRVLAAVDEAWRLADGRLERVK